MVEKIRSVNKSKTQQEQKHSLITYLESLGFKSKKALSYLSQLNERIIQDKIEKLESLGINAIKR